MQRDRHDAGSIVLSDRGLESPELFRAIAALGWHPLMRVKAHGTFRPEGWHKGYPMKKFSEEVGRRWKGQGVAYPGGSKLACTLLACWEEGYEDAWLVLTDLAPQSAEVGWYGFRAWIEQGLKRLKSGGWELEMLPRLLSGGGKCRRQAFEFFVCCLLALH